MKKPDFLKKVRKVHVVGIKGVAMAALACCLQDLKIGITGSDVKEFFVTNELLKKRKIKWQVGFDEKFLKYKPDLVITTGAHGGLENPQVLAAKKIGIPVLTHAQALSELMHGREGISVCGVGGKTTTSSMIATIFDYARKKPSFAIGVGQINPLGDPGRFSDGAHFVAEADEYANSPGIDPRPRFSFQKPKMIVTTNIEHDHPDVYPSLTETKIAFQNFFKNLPEGGMLITNADNFNSLEVAKASGVNFLTYGFSPSANWRVDKLYLGEEQTIFDLVYQEAVIDQIKLKVPGRFNVLNAAAAFATAIFFGLDAKLIKEGLARFGGTRRRFEFIGEVGGIKLYDDYAHHPQEIKATLSAAKFWLPRRRLVVVFQPHTFSRTKALYDEFSRSFSLADQVIITDIYASAREKDDLMISGKLLAEGIKKYQAHVQYLPGEDEVISFLQGNTLKNDLVITMGAGNIFLWHKSILKSFR